MCVSSAVLSSAVSSVAVLSSAACLVGALFFVGEVGAARDADSAAPAPFGRDDNRHGFSQFETLPDVPGETTAEPLDYYRDTPRVRDDAPGGLFRQIVTAHGFEEDLDVRRGHLYLPVRPSEAFPPDIPAVYTVFRVFTHQAAYHVIGRLFPERVRGFSGDTFTDEDTVSLAVEDDSGYLKFFAPSTDGWPPGVYRIDIFAGFEANDITRMGTLRFTIDP